MLYPASTLISVFGKHFEANTHVANDQADNYLPHFRCSFSNVKYLSPLGYFNLAGEDATHKVCKEKRPPSLAFVLVDADILLSHLHEFLKKEDVYNFWYYLRLPQKHKVATAPQGLMTGASTTTAAVPSVSTPSATYTVLHQGAPFTPIRHPVGGGSSTTPPSQEIQFLLPRVSRTLRKVGT